MNCCRTIFFSALLGLAPAGPSRAELPRYSVTPVRSDSLGINNRGDILSYTVDLTGAVGYRLEQAGDGRQTGGLSPPPVGWDGFSINRSTLSDSGTIALEVYRQNGPEYKVEAAIADLQTGTVEILAGTPANGDDDHSPKFSNGGGYVVLQAGPARGQLQPYLYSRTAGWQPLGNLTPGGDGRPLGINDAGSVVGRVGSISGETVPFIYTDAGGMQPITDDGSIVFGRAEAISNSGLVTGTGNGRAFIFDSNTLEFRYITDSATAWNAFDINDSGAIIGATRMGGSILGTPTDSAFYWDAEAGLSDLDDLIGNQVNDWFITDAVDINDEGWILATGFRRADRSYHQVILRPIPEPGATVLAVAGVSGLITSRRRIVRPA
jgi:hypothetical protein